MNSALQRTAFVNDGGRRESLRDCFFFFQAEDGIRDLTVTGVQTCALPIFQSLRRGALLDLTEQAPSAIGGQAALAHEGEGLDQVKGRDPVAWLAAQRLME